MDCTALIEAQTGLAISSIVIYSARAAACLLLCFQPAEPVLCFVRAVRLAVMSAQEQTERRREGEEARLATAD